MQNNMEGVLKVILGVAGIFSSVLLWWVSRLLSDKKDIITNSVNIESLKERVSDLEEEVRDNRRGFEQWKDSRNH